MSNDKIDYTGPRFIDVVLRENPELVTVDSVPPEQELTLAELTGEAERIAANLEKTGHYLARTIMRELVRRLAGAKVQDADLLPLQKFADTVLDEWWENSFDGGEIQEIGVACGLLEEFTQPEPCGDHCPCAEAGADFPTTCIRRTPTLQRALLAVHRADAAAAAQSENTTRENDNG